MLESQNDVIQQIQFRSKFVFYGLGGTSIVKEKILSKNWKILHYWHLNFKFLAKVSTFNSVGFLGKSKIIISHTFEIILKKPYVAILFLKPDIFWEKLPFIETP